MPIEIRELVIKTTVEKQPLRNPVQEMPDKAELKKEILQSCSKLMKKMLKESKQRA